MCADHVSGSKGGDPFIYGITNRISEKIDDLAKDSGGIRGMDYFYKAAKKLYTDRARELKAAKAEGKKIIGLFCNFVPEELIYAAGAIPIRLSAGLQETILPSEEILPRNFCPLIKSALGFAIERSPHFEHTDVIIIPTTCDGKKKLSEILGEMKTTWSLEVPHTIETPQARELWLTELGLLKTQLEKLTGNKITKRALKREINLHNRKRAALRRFYEIRKRVPPTIWGRDALLVTNLSFYDDSERWTRNLEKLCNELEKRPPVCDSSSPRILLTGCPVVFPVWKIPILIEESNGIIVSDDVCMGSKGLWDPVEVPHWTMGEMLIGLADRYLMNTCACFTPNLARMDRLTKFIEDFKVDGVLYHTLQACHVYGMEIPRTEKALKAMNISLLKIETDYSQEDVEQIRTRLEAFIEMIIAKKGIRLAGADVRRPQDYLAHEKATAGEMMVNKDPRGPPGPPPMVASGVPSTTSSAGAAMPLREQKLTPPDGGSTVPLRDQKLAPPGGAKVPLREQKLAPPGGAKVPLREQKLIPPGGKK